jgi:hypothetical protein
MYVGEIEIAGWFESAYITYVQGIRYILAVI